MSSKIRPLSDRVLIRPIKEESVGGIIIPNSNEKPDTGEVIAVGQGKRNENGEPQTLNIKIGEKVLFGKYAGTEVKLNGEDFMVIREEDVIGVFE